MIDWKSALLPCTFIPSFFSVQLCCQVFGWCCLQPADGSVPVLAWRNWGEMWQLSTPMGLCRATGLPWWVCNNQGELAINLFFLRCHRCVRSYTQDYSFHCKLVASFVIACVVQRNKLLIIWTQNSKLLLIHSVFSSLIAPGALSRHFKATRIKQGFC